MGIGKRKGKVVKGAGNPGSSGSDAIGGSLSKDDHWYLQQGFGFAGGQTAPVPDFDGITGGTKVTIGTRIYHQFTASGSLVVTDISDAPGGASAFDIMIVGGGGGGATDQYVENRGAGGGGAGGLRVLTGQTLANGTYDISIGAGGAGSAPTGSAPPTRQASDGNTTHFGPGSGLPLTVGGGAGGGGHDTSTTAPGATTPEGSGGGGANGNPGGTAGTYGNAGGAGGNYPWGSGGGGGGAGGAGSPGPGPNNGGAGGAGSNGSIIPTPSPLGVGGYFAGGGGGKGSDGPGSEGAGGSGGGGTGCGTPDNPTAANLSCSSPTKDGSFGGGGGGTRLGPTTTTNRPDYRGGNGGSGVIVVRYPK